MPNQFDRPVNTPIKSMYAPLPLQAYVGAGLEVQKRRDKNKADALGLSAQLELDSIPEDRQRRDEGLSEFENEIMSYVDKGDFINSEGETMDMALRLHKYLTRGEGAAIKKRKEMDAANIATIENIEDENLRNLYKQHYLNNREEYVEDLNYDPQTNTYGRIKSINPVGKVDVDKKLMDVLDRVKSEQVSIARPELYDGEDNLFKINIEGETEYIPYEKIEKALATYAFNDPETAQYLNELERLNGVDEEGNPILNTGINSGIFTEARDKNGNIIKGENGKPILELDRNTVLGAKIDALATAGSFTREDRRYGYRQPNEGSGSGPDDPSGGYLHAPALESVVDDFSNMDFQGSADQDIFAMLDLLPPDLALSFKADMLADPNFGEESWADKIINAIPDPVTKMNVKNKYISEGKYGKIYNIESNLKPYQKNLTEKYALTKFNKKYENLSEEEKLDLFNTVQKSIKNLNNPEYTSEYLRVTPNSQAKTRGQEIKRNIDKYYIFDPEEGKVKNGTAFFQGTNLGNYTFEEAGRYAPGSAYYTATGRDPKFAGTIQEVLVKDSDGEVVDRVVMSTGVGIPEDDIKFSKIMNTRLGLMDEVEIYGDKLKVVYNREDGSFDFLSPDTGDLIYKKEYNPSTMEFEDFYKDE